VEWYGMAEPNNKSWIKWEDQCKPYCEKDYMEDEIMTELWEQIHGGLCGDAEVLV
jgi:hypothetical protein